MDRFHVGDKVLTQSRTFAGHVGEIVRIQQSGRRNGRKVWLWIIFPGHPWHAIEPTPFAFEAQEVRRKDNGSD